MHLIFIALFLVGCSYNEGDVRVMLGKFYDTNLEKKGFNQKINSFQFLLKNAIEDMLYDLNHQDFGCRQDKELTLDVLFQSHDLYTNIKAKGRLQKKQISYSIYYILDDSGKKVSWKNKKY